MAASALKLDMMEALLRYDVDCDVVNEAGSTPLSIACQCNNMAGAKLLIERGANVRAMNARGLTPFDYISDYEDWIKNANLGDEMVARLKAFSLKQTRDLIRAISEKINEGVHSPTSITNRQMAKC
jgi:hypothetical protein